MADVVPRQRSARTERNSSKHPSTMPQWLRGRFAPVRELGSGTFAAVFLARDSGRAAAASCDSQVACKVSWGADHVKAALHEARLMARLRHPHIVRLHELLTPGGKAGAARDEWGSEIEGSTSARSTCAGTASEAEEAAEPCPAESCLVLSAAMGGSLHHVVGSNGPLAMEAVGMLGLQLASALAYLASPEHSVVHLDLKPANVVFAREVPTAAHSAWQQPADRRHPSRLGLQAQICDFGLCVELEGPDVKNTTIRRGTPGYVAPEVAFLKGFDCKADVFSLGCVLYEAMTGERLFHGTDRADTYRRNAHVLLPPHFPKQAAGTQVAACPPGALREAEVLRRVHCMLQPAGERPAAEDLVDLPW